MQTNRYSQSEIEALGIKAARGAGYDWGMAEEAGMAARWLAHEGLPGPKLLLACLQAPRGQAPVIAAAGWQVQAGAQAGAGAGARLCPLLTGAALSDRAGLADGPGRVAVTLRDIGHPALVLPFAAQAAARLGQPLALIWEGAEVVRTTGGRLVVVAAAGLGADHAAQLDVSAATDCAPSARGEAGYHVPDRVWNALVGLALATTVPATSRSRAGAGSSTSDND
ncbi:MAG: DUF3726 domain-containing protein [Albidovulum sp.]